MRRAHAGGRVLVGRALVDAAVGLLDQRDDALLAVRRAVARVARAALRGESRGELARLRAAHAVRDREQRGLADVRVLVPPPLAARCRGTDAWPRVISSKRKSVSPILTTSPGSQSLRPSAGLAVDEGAVRRADVVDPDAVPARLERVRARDEAKSSFGKRDVVLAVTADGQRRGIQRVPRSPASSAGLRRHGGRPPSGGRRAAPARGAPA